MNRTQNKKRKGRQLPKATLGDIGKQTDTTEVAGSSSQHGSNAGFLPQSLLPAADPALITLFCIIHGDDTPFPVQIRPDVSVGVLKEKVKEAKRPRLDGFAADELQLWKLNDPISAGEIEDKLPTLGTDLESFAQKMNPMLDISDYLPPKSLLRKHLHLIVEVPEPTTAPITPPNTAPGLPLEHTPPKPSKEYKNILDKFLNECRPMMQELVQKAHNVSSFLPSWPPPDDTDATFAKHIEGLAIPSVDELPSLLLHDLGEKKDDLDKERIERIPLVFSINRHMVLINTSGSGKTRLLLDGLCHRWGFYFVASTDTTGIGSMDLFLNLGEVAEARDYDRAKKLKNSDPQNSVKHIRKATEHRLVQLVLARFLVLDLLVEEAQKLPGGLREKEHRRLWVLLQALPTKLYSKITFKQDIFTDLCRLLRFASTEYLRNQVVDLRKKLSHLLGQVHNPATGQLETLPFFCVLDEVQIAVRRPFVQLDEFVSEDLKHKRPILREIWITWTNLLQPKEFHLVLSGTGIELQNLEITLASGACKPHRYFLVRDIGAFDKPLARLKYIQRYIPMLLEDDPRWKGWLTRVSTWVHGRFRFTASLISYILEGGCNSPHKTLDKFIFAYTGFTPTDGAAFTNSEPDDTHNRTILIKPNFDKLNPEHANTLCRVIHNQIIYGSYEPHPFNPEEEKLFVEYGFARHKNDTTVIDEPLAILVAVQWLETHPNLSMFNFLSNNINNNNRARNGLEAYLMFYLRNVFGNPAQLDRVFEFREDFANDPGAVWQQENFELVTVTTTDESEIRVSVASPTSGPSCNVAVSAASHEDVVEWLTTNRMAATFLFPTRVFGPDLLLFIRSCTSGKLFLVMIQIKRYEAVKAPDLIEGVRTVTPSWLWKRKSAEFLTAKTAPFNVGTSKFSASTKRALRNIQNGLTLQGADYPVLRIFASWPADPKLERTLGSSIQEGNKRRRVDPAYEDTDPHPLAALRLEQFNKIGREFDKRRWLGTEQVDEAPGSSRTEYT